MNSKEKICYSYKQTDWFGEVIRIDKKAHIINVATSLFQQKGYMSVGLNELLSACHCSRGAFYHHFPLGKEQLLLSCLSTLKNYIAEDCEQSFREHPSTILAIQAIIGKLIRDYKTNGKIIGYTFTSIVSELGAVSEEVRLACESLYDQLTKIIARHLEREGFDPHTATHRALFIITAIEGAIMLTLTKKSTLPLEIISSQLEHNI